MGELTALARLMDPPVEIEVIDTRRPDECPRRYKPTDGSDHSKIQLIYDGLHYDWRPPATDVAPASHSSVGNAHRLLPSRVEGHRAQSASVLALTEEGADALRQSLL